MPTHPGHQQGPALEELLPAVVSSQASMLATSSPAGHQAHLNHTLEMPASPGPTPELLSYHHGCFWLCPP